MIDPTIGTGLTALGAALGGKDLVVKLLGPTADYLGGGMKNFAERRVENVKNIFSNASEKLGSKMDDAGGVNPKVLKGVLEDGSYADDFLAVDYFGGVLASSRTGISRDDRGAYFNGIISRLSTYQLRFHYLAYHLLKSTFNDEEFNINLDSDRNRLRYFIPFNTFFFAMDLVGSEIAQMPSILSHVIIGLVKEDLIDKSYRYGSVDQIKNELPDATEQGIIIQPSPLGIELFLWAYGEGLLEDKNMFFSGSKQFKIDQQLVINGQAKRILKK